LFFCLSFYLLYSDMVPSNATITSFSSSIAALLFTMAEYTWSYIVWNFSTLHQSSQFTSKHTAFFLFILGCLFLKFCQYFFPKQAESLFFWDRFDVANMELMRAIASVRVTG
jgi:hypothetical protein